MSPSKRSRQQLSPIGLSPREQGLRAFNAGRLDAAITAWQPIAADPAVARALAEAYFRRALGPRVAGSSTDPITDLRSAAQLNPTDIRFQFHLGRLLHRAGDLPAAAKQYHAVLSREPGHIAAAKLLVLLSLQQDSSADVTGLPGVTPALRTWVAPALAVMHGQPAHQDDGALGTLWRGMSELSMGNPDARASLSDERTLPVPSLEPLRRYFRATSAALAGDADAALRLWDRLYDAENRAPGLDARLSAVVMDRLTALVDAGNVMDAGNLAYRWYTLPGGAGFDELRLLALDRAARAAAADGVWHQSSLFWEAARRIISSAQGIGSPRPILHNIALSYERQDRWMDAADVWRALLRTRPRKRAGDASDAQEDQRWAWVRARIITCYRNIGRPDEAVAVFRQGIKLDPNDLDLRFQLATALLANDQDRAAQNEIKRILQIDPYHPDALLYHVAFLSADRQFSEAQRLIRELAERNPDRADLQIRIAEVFMEHGRQLSEYGNFQAAYNAFVDGERYNPNDPHFPLNEARMLIAMRKPGDTGALIERALTVSGEQNAIWGLAIETWMIADKIDETRALIARFERERTPSATDYVDLGVQMMSFALPPPTPAFFAAFGSIPQPVDTPWTQLALGVFDKAVALQPDGKDLFISIAHFLMLPRPDLARPFADRAVTLAPDDPEALILLGVVLGLNDKVPEAKSTLQRAAKLAQRVGREDLHAHAQELRRAVDTPMLRMMLLRAFQNFDGPDEFGEAF